MGLKHITVRQAFMMCGSVDVIDETVLERRHEGIHKWKRDKGTRDMEISVSVTLECQRNPNRFHMVVVNNAGFFIDYAFNVCNWPVEEWSLEQVRECVRIFEDEYAKMCERWSVLCSDTVYPPTCNAYHVFSDSTSFVSTDIKCPVSAEDDIVLLMWKQLNAPLDQRPTTQESENSRGWDSCTWRLDEGRFGVCDQTMDISYDEAIFPFHESSDGMRRLIKNNLKTLWELSKRHPDARSDEDEGSGQSCMFFETPDGNRVLVPSAFSFRDPATGDHQEALPLPGVPVD